jgi:hypothetical protein
MSCGSESFWPWKTTTSRSRHTSSIVSLAERDGLRKIDAGDFGAQRGVQIPD